MSFGLSRGKPQEFGVYGLTEADLPTLQVGAGTDKAANWIDPRAWFPQPDRPFEIEIGSGKGTFLVQQAARQADTNFLGIEYAGEFFRYAADRVRRRQMDNVRLLYVDASTFVALRCPSAIARVVHLYFSDPWPKKRHHKRRVVQDSFLCSVHRVLLPGGELRIVTDHADYWAWMEDHFVRWCAPARASDTDAADDDGTGGLRFERDEFVPPESARDGEVVGTNFERKYREEGRVFRATVLRKPAASEAT